VALGMAGATLLCALMAVAMHPEPVETLGFVLSGIAGGAFVLWRASPVACLAIAAAAVCAYTASDAAGGPIYVALFIAAINLGAQRTETRQWLPWTAAAAVALVISEIVVGDIEFHFLPVVALLIVLPKVMADRAHERRLRTTALEARVQSAEQETLRRMAEERLRIAREVHDVVGHGLAAISLRAGVADHVRDRDPEEVADALRAIREVSKHSLAELSSLLGALRDGEPAERAPAPDLAHVPRLVGTLRDAGLPVELEGRANGADVPEIVGAAGYRIVQEALTNVARHAGNGASARVRIESDDGQLEVEVVDDGRGASMHRVSPGSGLTGMYERAQALGGRFEAGNAPGGGFRVWASLPMRRS
jgi:signal transduction histidine kinase